MPTPRPATIWPARFGRSPEVLAEPLSLLDHLMEQLGLFAGTLIQSMEAPGTARSKAASPESRWEAQPIAGTLKLYRDKHAPISNFYRVDASGSLYRGAQPGILGDNRIDAEKLKQGLLYLRDVCGVRTIVNLRNKTDLKPDAHGVATDHQEKEAAMVALLNRDAPADKQFRYIPLPMRSGSALTDAQFPKLLATLQEATPDNPTFIHCKAGIDRTGLAVSLYRALKAHPPETIPFGDIYREMQHCGHNPNGLWKGYVYNIVYHLRSKPALTTYYRRNLPNIRQVLRENRMKQSG